MTITNGYATLVELKDMLGVTVDSTDDQLERAIETASRMIDQHTGRRFYADSVATARVFYRNAPELVYLDDVSSTSGLVVATDADDDGTYETTWASTDYQLLPLNGIGPNGASSWPYTALKAVATRTFPGGLRPTTQVTAKWGWAACPTDVAYACRLLAHTLWRSKDAAFGAATVGDLGLARTRMSMLVLELLAEYVRKPFLVG